MAKQRHTILAIHVTERLKHAVQVQQALSEHGCYIKTRLGLHETSDSFCSPNGLIILEMLDNDAKVRELQARLAAIEGIETKRIDFDH